MSDKKLLIKEGNTLYEFFMQSLEPNKSNMRLIRSMLDSKWQQPGEAVIDAVDDGDGLVVKMKGKRKLHLDYAEAMELAIVLMEHAAADKNAEKPVYRKFKEEV